MNKLIKVIVGLLMIYTAGFFAMDQARLNQYQERTDERRFFVQRALNTIHQQNESREKQGLPKLTEEEVLVILEMRVSNSEKQI